VNLSSVRKKVKEGPAFSKIPLAGEPEEKHQEGCKKGKVANQDSKKRTSSKEGSRGMILKRDSFREKGRIL